MAFAIVKRGNHAQLPKQLFAKLLLWRAHLPKRLALAVAMTGEMMREAGACDEVWAAAKVLARALGEEVETANPFAHDADAVAVIGSSDVLVADLHERDTSVMTAVGIAEAQGKPILLLVQDPKDLPYHLKNRRVLLWERPSATSALRSTQRLVDALLPLLTRVDAAHKPSARRNVFASYSHQDQEFLVRLLVHLRPLERMGLIDLWSDRKIKPGDRWRDELGEALRRAQVAILLISADFLASDFIQTDELPATDIVSMQIGAASQLLLRNAELPTQLSNPAANRHR